VFFDSRTINPEYQKIGPLLFESDDANPPIFGVKDSSNQWATSKVIFNFKIFIGISDDEHRGLLTNFIKI